MGLPGHAGARTGVPLAGLSEGFGGPRTEPRTVEGNMSDRILTTHVGSLPRPEDVSELLVRRAADEAVDQALFDATVARAVHDIVAQQKQAGIDIPSDGEMSKISYATYISERLTGFSGDSPRRVPGDLALVPRFRQRL